MMSGAMAGAAQAGAAMQFGLFGFDPPPQAPARTSASATPTPGAATTALATAPAAMPAGTWLAPRRSVQEMVALYAQAHQALRRAPAGIVREVFEERLEAACMALQAQRARCGDAHAASLARPDDSSIECDRAVAFAEAAQVIGTAGAIVRARVRVDEGHGDAGVEVEGAGSVVVRWWGEEPAATFVRWRDRFMLDSWKDEALRIEAASALWSKAYSADVLCMSGDEVASVPACQVGAHLVTVTGMTGGGRIERGWGWQLVPAARWSGVTYSYTSHCEAMERGSIERGDSRGVRVRVHGRECVMARGIVLIDKGLCQTADGAPACEASLEHDAGPLLL